MTNDRFSAFESERAGIHTYVPKILQIPDRILRVEHSNVIPYTPS